MKREQVMNCPQCGNNIPWYKLKAEFDCSKCGSCLKSDNYVNTYLGGLAIYLAITFILDFVTDFFSMGFTMVILYNVLIFLLVMSPVLKRLRYKVLRVGDKK